MQLSLRVLLACPCPCCRETHSICYSSSSWARLPMETGSAEHACPYRERFFKNDSTGLHTHRHPFHIIQRRRSMSAGAGERGDVLAKSLPHGNNDGGGCSHLTWNAVIIISNSSALHFVLLLTLMLPQSKSCGWKHTKFFSDCSGALEASVSVAGLKVIVTRLIPSGDLEGEIMSLPF